MKTSSTRRIRRHSASSHETGPRRENKDQKFFGSESHEPFFPAAPSIQRTPEIADKEETVQRTPEKEEKEKEKEKEKDPSLKRAPERKDEEKKLSRAADKADKKEEKKEEGKIHKKESPAVAGGGETTSDYIDSIDSKGQPMSAKEQSFFGNKMGYDFSNVKVHTGREAADSARDVSARAYTYGRHIVFNDGQYNTESHDGRTLIAHELTHVVQQGSTHAHGKGNGAVHGTASPQAQRGYLADVAGYVWDVLKSAGAWIWDLVTWLPWRMWSMLKHLDSVIVGTMTWLWTGLTGSLAHIWDGLKGVLPWVEDGVEGLFSWVWRGLQGGAQWAWKLLHGDFSAFWTGIGDAFSWLGDGIMGLLSWGWKGLEGVVVWAGQGIVGLAKWIWDGIVGGLAWIGRFVAKLFDIIGAGELWTLLMNILKGWSTRTMTSAEITEATKVFDSSIAYWQVRIDEMSLIAALGAWFKGSKLGMGVTTAHTINFDRTISSAAGSRDMAWLIHELGHVAQYTYVGLQYMGEAIHAQVTEGYDYGGGAALAGKDLKDFNREQQASILSHYYLNVLYGSSPYAADYTRMRNQAVHGDL